MIRWTTLFLDRPAATFDAARDFWLASTGSTSSPVRGEHGEFLTSIPPDGDAHLRLQRVHDGPGGSHLDLHVDDVRAATDRIVELGADIVDDLDALVVLRSPGGLPFCTVAHHDEAARPMPIGAPGARTRADQVCIDIAPDRFDRECRFWADVTGWSLRTAVEPEFNVLERPPDQPHRFLLQRRGEADTGLDAQCHLDLACDDVDRAVEDHLALGAGFVERFRWWAVMTDPAGVPYCLTPRNPDTGVGT